MSTVRRLARNALIDIRFGFPLSFAYLRNRKQSNSDYRDLEEIFQDAIEPSDVLVDVGCGAGRVINHWLRMGVKNPIYGLELDARLGSTTRRRLRRFTNVSILIGDAVENLPADGSIFFLFNPFDGPTIRRFAEAIKTSTARADVSPTILYLNCKHAAVFGDDPAFNVEIEKLGVSGQSVATITLR